MSELDPNDTTPRKVPRPRNQARRKQDDGNSPATPVKKSHATNEDVAHGGPEKDGTESQTPIRRAKQTPNTNKTKRHVSAAGPITSFDGAAPTQIGGTHNSTHHNRTMTPVKQAYAGPTFHASPAPSSLPIPKFFSKIIPPGATQASPTAQIRTNTAGLVSMPPSPAPADVLPGPQPPIPREESPLDLFFNAHRAEQARQKAGGNLENLSPRPSLSGAQASSRPSTPIVPIPGHNLVQHQSSSGQRPSEKEMFMMELDGIHDQHVAHDADRAIPFKERITAAQKTSSQSSTPTKATMDEQERMAKSLALKQLLKVVPATSEPWSFNEQQSSDAQQYMNISHAHRAYPSEHSQYSSAPSGSAYEFSLQGNQTRPVDTVYRQHQPATTDTVQPRMNQNYSQPPNVKAMEADLKRLLKLDLHD